MAFSSLRRGRATIGFPQGKLKRIPKLNQDQGLLEGTGTPAAKLKILTYRAIEKFIGVRKLHLKFYY